VAHPPASDRVTPNAQTVLYAIKAHDTQGKESVVSDPISVFLPPAPPVLASPANRAINVPTPPTLNWNASTGATSYRLQVSTNTSFSPTVLDQSGIATTSYGVSDLANNTTYNWRANATNAGGTSSWSSTRSFTTIPSPPPPRTSPSPSNGTIYPR
jgi:hypothetical protein